MLIINQHTHGCPTTRASFARLLPWLSVPVSHRAHRLLVHQHPLLPVGVASLTCISLGTLALATSILSCTAQATGQVESRPNTRVYDLIDASISSSEHALFENSSCTTSSLLCLRLTSRNMLPTLLLQLKCANVTGISSTKAPPDGECAPRSCAATRRFVYSLRNEIVSPR